MHYRAYLVGASVGLLASVAIASTPAVATPCTNLQSPGSARLSFRSQGPAVHWRQRPARVPEGDQVTTMRKYYAGTIDPVSGQVINPGALRGNETDNVFALGLALQEQLPEPAFDGLFYWGVVRASAMRPAPTTLLTFDFHHDVNTWTTSSPRC